MQRNSENINLAYVIIEKGWKKRYNCCFATHFTEDFRLPRKNLNNLAFFFNFFLLLLKQFWRHLWCQRIWCKFLTQKKYYRTISENIVGIRDEDVRVSLTIRKRNFVVYGWVKKKLQLDLLRFCSSMMAENTKHIWEL